MRAAVLFGAAAGVAVSLAQASELLIVALEIVVVPLAPGLPVFALIFSIANVVLELYRIRSKTRRWPGLRSRREH